MDRFFYSRFKVFVALVFILMSVNSYGQATGEGNLPTYNRTWVHFGFIIAVNTTNFQIQPIQNLSGHFNDSLKTIRSSPQSGFNLGIVSELKIGKYLKLRFVPDLAFGERDLTYSFAGVDTFAVTKKIQSTFLDFPVDIKLISKRQMNFEAYVMAGGKYVTDLASQKNVNEGLLGPNEVVRLIRNDFAYEAGGGLEFYFPYFKFALELKASLGIRNLLVRDNTVFTQSIETLRSRMFLVSFCFEG